MEDTEILERINRLVGEERALLDHEETAGAEGEHREEDRTRLTQLQGMLDQCWDLLRQRRALREAGADPSSASVRDIGTVERYQQ